jgi:OOP family OmpA-OmpF porin
MKQFNKLALALAASLVAGSAMADGPQLYAAGGVGQSEYTNDGCDNTPSGVSCDDKDTSWKIAGGAQFNQYLAVEFQYQDLGELSVKANGVHAGAEGETVGFHVLPQLPLTEDLSIYARLGFVRAGLEGTGAASGSDWQTTNTYGLGLQWNIDDHFAVRGEYEFVNKIGDDEGGLEEDVNYFGVTGLYKF